MKQFFLMLLTILISVGCNKESNDLDKADNCGDFITDVEGNRYNVTKIGNQCWMAENLRTTKYSDNELIPMGTPMDTLSESEPELLYFNYDEDDNSDIADFTILNNHLELTTKYYTWNAATRMNETGSESEIIQGVCPIGWRLPNLNDWRELEEFVGRDSAGLNLKSDITGMWYDLNQDIFTPGNNIFNFNAEATGRREFSEFNSFPGVSGEYWSSTIYSETASYKISFSCCIDYVQIIQLSKSVAACVRCIKDD